MYCGCYSKKDARESMIYSYKHGFSGFAAHLTSSQAKKLSGSLDIRKKHYNNSILWPLLSWLIIAEHPDVVQVTRDSYYEPQTTRTYDFLGLSQSNPEGLLLQARMGEDIIIGFVDSGKTYKFEIYIYIVWDDISLTNIYTLSVLFFKSF